MNKANILLELNKMKDALDCYNKVIELDSNNSEAFLNKGFVLINLQREQEAFICFENAIRINPDHKDKIDGIKPSITIQLSA